MHVQYYICLVESQHSKIKDVIAWKVKSTANELVASQLRAMAEKPLDEIMQTLFQKAQIRIRSIVCKVAGQG